MQTYTFYKANVGPDDPDNATAIQITETLPELAPRDSLRTWQYIEADQARAINKALRQSLPGGVYHRLLGEMMLTQASDWMVPVTKDE